LTEIIATRGLALSMADVVVIDNINGDPIYQEQTVNIGTRMDDQARDYAVGYGKPPAETRFQKGQSGNPEGRPRGTKKLVTLLAEVLSQRSGLPNPDGTWMTKAEAIFFSLASQAATPDLKAKKLLFDVLVKLQQANICFTSDRLPEIQFDDIEGGATMRLPRRATGPRQREPRRPGTSIRRCA
jgi:hypothetical protein